MRRTVLLLAGMVLAVLLAGGIAVAANITCPTSDDGSGLCRGTEEDDTLSGTVELDRMWAYDGNDTLFGNEGGDDLWGMAGNDVLYGNEGADTLGVF